MFAITLGEKYPDPEAYRREGPEFLPAGTPTMIVLTMNGIRDEELTAIRDEEMAFVFAEPDGVPVLMANPGGVEGWWITMPWLPITQQDCDDILADNLVGPEDHLTVVIVLIEQRTGVVAAQRMLTWSPTFGQAVDQSLRRHATAGPVPPENFVQRARAMYSKFPETSDMMKVAVSRTRSGQ